MDLTLESLEQRLGKFHGAAAPKLPIFSKITVILGSSRSGSSLLFRLLTECGAFNALQGEETPFYRLAGKGWVRKAVESDVIRVPVDVEACERARRWLARDVGLFDPAASLSDARYIAQCATRLVMQWPGIDDSPRSVLSSIRALAAKAKTPEELWTALFAKYDLPTAPYDWPGARDVPSARPAVDRYLEEPPYVIQRPRAPADPSRPLLLKSSTNVYRIKWLKTLFPNAEFTYIHLRRNPAASINGLMDGWLSNAFYSHNLKPLTTLKIRGYSDILPGGDSWWKFDLPPGWADYVTEPLAEVCAFQWRSAYREVAALNATGVDVAFEDLVNAPDTPKVMERIFESTGTSPKRKTNKDDLPFVLASKAPSRAHWRARAKEIWPLVQRPAVRAVAERMGYDLEASEGWL